MLCESWPSQGWTEWAQCEFGFSSSAQASPSVTILQPGEPLDPGLRPDAAACRRQLTADIDAAKRLRTELRIDGISSTDAAVTAAADDPGADVATLGIPLTTTELATLRASGTLIDHSSPLVFWVQAAEPGRFGGIWIDPPGSSRYVVAILNSDRAALTLARCLDGEVDVRYVAATRSVADHNALVARISADMDELRSNGVLIQSVGISVRTSVMVVVVGVTGVTDAIRAELTARYGDAIVVEEQPPITPA